jgi:hypothetical protein
MGLFGKKKIDDVVPSLPKQNIVSAPRPVIPALRPAVLPAAPVKPTGSGFPEKKVSLVLTDFTPGAVLFSSGFLENPKLGERVSRLLYREFVREDYETFLKDVEQKNLDVQEEQKRYLEEFAKLEEELYGKKPKKESSSEKVPDEIPPLEDNDETSYGEE